MVQQTPDPVASASRRAWARDAGIVRVRRLTGLAIAAAAALSGVFAGLAASAAPGRKVVHTTSRADPPSKPLRVEQAPRPKPKPKPKPRVETPAAPQTQAAPQTTPAPAPAPPPATTTTVAAPPPAPPPAPPVVVQQQAPVIVSGGS